MTNAPGRRRARVGTELHAVPLTPRQRLDDVVRLFGQWQGGTDVALPISYALGRKLEFDAIVVITDNETWAGRQHPIQALRRYRETVNPAAKTVVLAATANAGSVVPDDDPLSLGCASFGEDTIPHRREKTNPWDMAKDGKRWMGCVARNRPAMMRK